MKAISALALLILAFTMSFAHAIDLEAPCPFCQANHINNNNILANNIINIDFLAINQALLDFPCLAVQITHLGQSDFMPQREHESCVRRVLPGNYALSKDHLLRLLFLSSIRAENHKVPVTSLDNQFWHQRIPHDKASKRALAWVTASLFIVFSASSALTNFFGFITVYIYPANITNTSSPVVDDSASLWAQNVPQSFLTFVFGFLSSLTNFSWTEFSESALETRTTDIQDRIRALDEDFRDLSLALLILSFHQPHLGITIASEIDEAVLLERIMDLQPPRRGPIPQGVRNFIGAVEYIKSNGTLLPKSLELQTEILMLERLIKI